jgi:hypothetical protein
MGFEMNPDPQELPEVPPFSTVSCSLPGCVAMVGGRAGRGLGCRAGPRLWPDDECITRGVGGIFPMFYGNGSRIAQTPDEGNGAVSSALSGERAYERMVAESKAKELPIPPRTMGMEVYSGAAVEGRQPVREFGGSAK